MVYQARFYRDWVGKQGLVSFSVTLAETDLQIRAQRELRSEARKLAERARRDVQTYARKGPHFLTSLSPLPIPDDCPAVVRAMLEAGKAYNVGPMAAVAGAIAEVVGRGLLARSPEVIVENGGDIWLQLPRPAVLSLYCGPKSPFADRLRVRVDGSGAPLGICTSSATVGHSLSFGKADAVMVVAEDAGLADAAATSLCNEVKTPADIEPLCERERKRGLLKGMIVVLGKHLAAWGAVELVET